MVERIARVYKLTDDDIVDLIIIRTSSDILQKLGTKKITTVKELWDPMDEAHCGTVHHLFRGIYQPSRRLFYCSCHHLTQSAHTVS